MSAGVVLQWAGLPRRNRARYWQGLAGLRIAGLHVMTDREFRRFQRFVDWCRKRFELASPRDVDALLDGCFEPASRDKLLFTFDDGHEPDYRVAEWLHREGIEAIFFVIPSYIGRSVREFMEYHRGCGIEPYDIGQHGDRDAVRALSRAQLTEMALMGHRIGAHNFAHRDLGRLDRMADLNYEIGEALASVTDLTGAPCEDFAWAFGRIKHLSSAAVRCLAERCPRVYSSIRGLNCPALSPRFLLRDAIDPGEPLSFARFCVRGGADNRYEAERSRMSEMVGGVP